MDTRENYPLYLSFLALLLFLTGLGSRDFWAPVEPRYAEIARVMFTKGEWLVPTINGDLYTDKPILYFWLVLLASKLVGSVNEWTVRLPAALSGVGFVLTTYVIGRDFFNPRTGFIAAAVVATSFRVIWEARWAHVDMIFGLFFVLSIYFVARSLLRQGRPNEILWAYFFMALATLAKGLIGVVLPALLLVSFMVVRRDWRLLTDAKLPLGIAIFLLVVAPWFYLVTRATGGKWLTDFLYIHHFQRYTAGAGHRQPFYYYFTTLPVDFLPWTIFAISALSAYRLDRSIKDRPASLFLVLWFSVVFLFFTLSDTKRDLYLLPLLPTLALSVAKYLDNLADGRLPPSILYRGITQLFFGLFAVVGLAMPIAAWFVRQDALWISLPAALVMAVGGISAAFYVRQRQPLKVVTATTLMMTFTVVCASMWILPYLEQFKSRRPFSLTINQIVQPSAPLYIYADTMNDFNYYTGREIIPVLPSRLEVEQVLAQPHKAYLLIKERDLARLAIIPPGWVVASDSQGSATWKLVEFKTVAVKSPAQ